MGIQYVRPDYRPIGSDGKVLSADSTQPNGTTWKYLTQSNIIDDFVISDLTSNYTIVSVNETLSSGSIIFNWSANEGLNVSGKITQGANVLWLNNAATSGIWPYDSQKTGHNQSLTYTLSASGIDTSGYDSETYTIYWRQKVYYGATTVDAYNSGFIHNLPYSSFSISGDLEFSDNVASGEYMYYAFRSAVGDPKFKDTINSLTGGFTLVNDSISLDNGYGYIENYQLWISDQPGLGTIYIESYF